MADIKRSKDDKKLLDSRPYTGIDFGFSPEFGIIIRFTTFNVNQLEIHSPICESTKDSCPYMEINIGFHALEGNP